ncbi:MAG: preprotein translocase subunit SecG [Defluviitaleaceae bacterium]|nr:preprotein translocase subunit SecG [Defluviitaleaceae bacterium]
MSPIYIVLTIVLGIACAVLITVVLLQKKRDAGFSGSAAMGGSGGGAAGQTHYEKNQGRTREGKMARLTKVLAALFMIMSLVVGFLA